MQGGKGILTVAPAINHLAYVVRIDRSDDRKRGTSEMREKQEVLALSVWGQTSCKIRGL